MGSVVAKLDSNNNIISITSDVKKLSKDDIDKIKKYYNSHGVIKVRVDMDQMDLFIQNYMKKLSKTSTKLEVSVKQNMRMVVGLGSMVVSNNGFIMIVDNEKPKSIEGFDQIEHFAEINEAKSDEELVDTFVKRPANKDFDISEYQKSKPETKAKLETDTKAKLETETKAKLQTETKAKLEERKLKEESEKEINLGKINIKQEVKPEIKVEKAPKMEAPNMPFVDVIIPKILLSSDRIEFINFISRLFAEDVKTKIVYSSFKKILEGIVVGSNPEIKIANLIGLSMRVAIMVGIATEAKKLGPNNFTEEDMINFTTQVVADFMTDFPADKCSFYSDKLNFIKFTPNICNVKTGKVGIRQEACPKCAECKETKCNCPQVKCPEVKCPVTKCPEMKCPPVVLPEMKCPPVVLPEMICPPVVLAETKPANINISDIKCPAVRIPDIKCPTVTVTENSSIWKVSTIIFVLLVIGLIVLMIMNKDGSDNSSFGKINNLSKLK